MSEYSSFFDSVKTGDTYDREYKAEDFAKYFSTLVSNGVFAGTTNLATQLASGFNVTLKAGKAFINGYYYELTEDKTLTVDMPSSSARIDRVVIALDFTARSITASIKKGTASSNPVPPTLQRDDERYELSVAQILINANSTDASLITDERADTAVCGYVTGLVESMDLSMFQNQFNAWFAQLQNQLDTNQAAHLQNQIDKLKWTKLLEVAQGSTGTLPTGSYTELKFVVLNESKNAICEASVPTDVILPQISMGGTFTGGFSALVNFVAETGNVMIAKVFSGASQVTFGSTLVVYGRSL